MTREDKIKSILAIAEGAKSPGRTEPIIWCNWTQGIYKAGINGKEVVLNESQYQAYVKKYGGINVVLRLTHTVEPEPEPMPPINSVLPPAAIVAKEPDPAPAITITGPQSTYKGIPFEELDWIDSPISERINFMFPRGK